MVTKGMTTMAVKQINLKKVYSSIYQDKETSKLKIVQKLQMGLSTVSQNLKELEEQGLIEKNGYLESTGGRPAHLITINPIAKTSIGVGILKDSVHLVLADLYGDVRYKMTHPISYEDTDAYYKYLGEIINQFIVNNHINSNSILGVSIAVQGIICSDGEAVHYGPIMNTDNMKLSDISQYIEYPCRLAHDSKAAAYLELWHHKNLESAVLLLLNHNLGGAIITNKQVHKGTHMRSGLIEHLCLNPEGPLCYCGAQGCFETYCSVNTLLEKTDMDIPTFFSELRNHNQICTEIWTEYLTYLAQAIRNITIIIDGMIIISGHLAPYFTDEDITYILEQVQKNAPFPISRDQIILGIEGQYTPAIGAALYYINDYLDTIMK